MPVDEALHAVAGSRIARSAVMRLEFESVEARRIMAGGDHDAADGVLGLDGERHRRCRSRFRRQHHPEAVAGQNLGRRLGEPIREKAAVVAHNNLVGGARDGICPPIIRRRLRHAGDVGKGEIFGDHCAPAVCSEFDVRHGQRFAAAFVSNRQVGQRWIVGLDHLAHLFHGRFHVAPAKERRAAHEHVRADPGALRGRLEVNATVDANMIGQVQLAPPGGCLLDFGQGLVNERLPAEARD